MDHVTFARFPDGRQAMTGMRGVQQEVGARVRMVAHWGASDAAGFEQVVQHSGDFAETDLRHALVVGVSTGLAAGAGCGAILAWIGIFPGTLVQGLGFGAFMGVLVGLLMMSILGTGLMDKRLQQLTRHLRIGDVVLTVHAEDRATCDRVEEILRTHGATVAEKSPV